MNFCWRAGSYRILVLPGFFFAVSCFGCAAYARQQPPRPTRIEPPPLSHELPSFLTNIMSLSFSEACIQYEYADNHYDAHHYHIHKLKKMGHVHYLRNHREHRVHREDVKALCSMWTLWLIFHAMNNFSRLNLKLPFFS